MYWVLPEIKYMKVMNCFTHPLSSSVKPMKTTFKSLIISDLKGELNLDSVMLVENSIMTYDKFNKVNIRFNEKVIGDFKLIDLTVLESALNI